MTTYYETVNSDEVVKAEDGHKMHRKHKSKTLKN